MCTQVSRGFVFWGVIQKFKLSLYEATTELCGRPTQMVLRAMEDRYDFVKTSPGEWRNSYVYDRFHCVCFMYIFFVKRS